MERHALYPLYIISQKIGQLSDQIQKGVANKKNHNIKGIHYKRTLQSSRCQKDFNTHLNLKNFFMIIRRAGLSRWRRDAAPRRRPRWRRDTNQEHTRDRKRKRENTANDELTSTSICRHIGLVESSPICSICRLVSPIYMILC